MKFYIFFYFFLKFNNNCHYDNEDLLKKSFFKKKEIEDKIETNIKNKINPILDGMIFQSYFQIVFNIINILIFSFLILMSLLWHYNDFKISKNITGKNNFFSSFNKIGFTNIVIILPILLQLIPNIFFLQKIFRYKKDKNTMMNLLFNKTIQNSLFRYLFIIMTESIFIFLVYFYLGYIKHSFNSGNIFFFYFCIYFLLQIPTIFFIYRIKKSNKKINQIFNEENITICDYELYNQNFFLEKIKEIIFEFNNSCIYQIIFSVINIILISIIFIQYYTDFCYIYFNSITYIINPEINDLFITFDDDDINQEPEIIITTKEIIHNTREILYFLIHIYSIFIEINYIYLFFKMKKNTSILAKILNFIIFYKKIKKLFLYYTISQEIFVLICGLYFFFSMKIDEYFNKTMFLKALFFPFLLKLPINYFVNFVLKKVIKNTIANLNNTKIIKNENNICFLIS